MKNMKSYQTSFIQDIRIIIETGRTNAIKSVDLCRVKMYWNIGKRIFEEEQQGKERADYGTYLLANLAKALEPEYGSGFSKRQLERARQFYRLYPIASALRTQLNWSQYKLLISISDKDKREYYELEAVHNLWTSRIEIKTHKLTHQDLGQLQMYVNYYDRCVKLAEESPTIGILLCTAKNDTMVKMSLPEDNKNILTSQYQLYLPSKEQLIEQVNEVKQTVQTKTGKAKM